MVYKFPRVAVARNRSDFLRDDFICRLLQPKIVSVLVGLVSPLVNYNTQGLYLVYGATLDMWLNFRSQKLS